MYYSDLTDSKLNKLTKAQLISIIKDYDGEATMLKDKVDTISKDAEEKINHLNEIIETKTNEYNDLKHDYEEECDEHMVDYVKYRKGKRTSYIIAAISLIVALITIFAL